MRTDRFLGMGYVRLRCWRWFLRNMSLQGSRQVLSILNGGVFVQFWPNSAKFHACRAVEVAVVPKRAKKIIFQLLK